MQNASHPPSAPPLSPDLEPDDEWKQTLKLNIEAGLRSMVDEAKQKLNDELAKGVIGPEERERLTADHLANLKTIRQLAEEQFRIALERERQERRWASGEQLDRAWSESMMKEQQAILDRIERERKNKTSFTPSLQPDPPYIPPPPPPPPPLPKHASPPQSSTPTPVPSIRSIVRTPTQPADTDGTYFSRPASFDRDDPTVSPDEIPSFRSTRKVRAGSITSISSWKPPSIIDTEKSFLERSKPSPIVDDPDALPRSARTPTDPPDPMRKESIRRKPSMTARPIVQEFWKPSITPEEDAQMSRTFTLARRSSTASAASSFKAPSVLSAAFSDPLDALSNNNSSSSNMDRERSTIHSAEQEWNNLDRARERDRERERAAYAHGGDDRSVHSVNISPTSVPYARAADASRAHIPPPSACRPIVNKRSFTLDDSFPSHPSPSSRHAASRSPYETRWDGSSRSPQTPEDVARSWQSSQLRGRFSSQDMRHYFQQEGSYQGSRHVHTHHERFEEDGSDDGFDNHSWRTQNYTERRIQDLEERLRKREEAADRREQELARKAEELKREDEFRKKMAEEQRREEEARKLDEEAKQRDEDEAQRRAEELRRKEEEANRKEREAAMKEQEAEKKEQEARKKEEEARRKEQETKKKEREVRIKEEKAKRKEEEASSREMEASKKEEEAIRKVKAVKMMEEEARRKEFEAQRKQEEAERKEEETRRKEEDLRKQLADLERREDDLKRREAEASRIANDKVQEEFRRREEEIRRQRAEDKKKQEVWETWPSETFRPAPSPQTPNSSGPWPIPNRSERTASTAASPPIDRVSTSASGRNSNASGWSTASTRPGSTTNTQPSSTPKPTGTGLATPTPKASTSSTPNPPLTEAEFHRRQAEQAQQREEQFRREQARLAMQDHERQAKAGKTMSKEEVTKLFEAHRAQWDKIQTLGESSLIWEDIPWPMFKRPKGPEDLTSPAITAYMLPAIHPLDKSAKERMKDGIRRWHPDNFKRRYLPKVKESESERVSEGSELVATILTDLWSMHFKDSV